jgi:hypothetical protein
MKCWNLTFNAQGSRVIIVVVQVGIVEIHVTTMEVFREKGKKTPFHPLSPFLVY